MICFTIRVFEDTEADAFESLINNESVEIAREVFIEGYDLNEIAEGAINIKFGEKSLEIMKTIRAKIDEFNSTNEENPIIISNNRWKNSASVLKTLSTLAGYDNIHPMFIPILFNCLWNTKEQIETIEGIVCKSIAECNVQDDCISDCHGGEKLMKILMSERQKEVMKKYF